MLLDRKELKKDNGEIVIEGYYDSSNILKSMYLPNQNHLFIFFQNKLVYSYSGVSKELYERFEKAESQGKFFIMEIKKKPKEFNYLREYKLYEFEKQDIISVILSAKSTQEGPNTNIL